MKSILTPPHTSWTHRFVRILVRPLVGTPVTPNVLTTARLIIGLLACALFARGDESGNLWGGIAWTVSCLLDYADGELARQGGLTSRWGHQYDYYSDVAINSLFFLAIGFDLAGGPFGQSAIVLGGLACLSIAVASILSEQLELESDSNDNAYSGVFGFDFEDLLFLFGPAAWFGLLSYILIGAAIVAPILAIVTWIRLQKSRQ